MSFLRPELLWLALPLLLLAAGYVRLQQRRRAAPLLRGLPLCSRAPAWQRHLAPLLLFVAALALVAAAGGPVTTVALPTDQRTLILAIDVSGSMEGRDIAPSRLGAAQAAAKAMVAELPRSVRIGVVAYADSAHLVQAPTVSHDAVIAALGRLKVEGGTAIGDGILCSLGAIFPREAGVAEALRRTADEERAARAARATPVKPGSYRSAAIVLLTDGQNSFGADPLEAARRVAARGVKIFTIGFGTAAGTMIGPENSSVLVRLDEDALRQIADTTGAEYFRAGSGMELRKVYQGLQSRLELDRHEVEVSGLFALAATVLIVIGSGLSLAWFGRIA